MGFPRSILPGWTPDNPDRLPVLPVYTKLGSKLLGWDCHDVRRAVHVVVRPASIRLPRLIGVALACAWPYQTTETPRSSCLPRHQDSVRSVAGDAGFSLMTTYPVIICTLGGSDCARTQARGLGEGRLAGKNCQIGIVCGDMPWIQIDGSSFSCVERERRENCRGWCLKGQKALITGSLFSHANVFCVSLLEAWGKTQRSPHSGVAGGWGERAVFDMPLLAPQVCNWFTSIVMTELLKTNRILLRCDS